MAKSKDKRNKEEQKESSGRFKSGKVARRQAWQEQARLETTRATQQPNFR